jgi:hypothetical protein
MHYIQKLRRDPSPEPPEIGKTPSEPGTQFLIKRCGHESAIVGYGVTTSEDFEDADFEDLAKGATMYTSKSFLLRWSKCCQ